MQKQSEPTRRRSSQEELNLSIPNLPFDRMSESLKAAFEAVGGNTASDLIALPREQQHALERIAADFEAKARIVVELGQDLAPFIGSNEAVGRLPAKAEPFVRRLIKDPRNVRVMTAGTGAGASLAEVLNPAGDFTMFLGSRFPRDPNEALRVMRTHDGLESGIVSKRAALALLASAYYDGQRALLNNTSPNEKAGLIAASHTGDIDTDGSNRMWGATRTIKGSAVYYIEFPKDVQKSRDHKEAVCTALALNSILWEAKLPQMPILDNSIQSKHLIPNPDGPGRILNPEPVVLDPVCFSGPGPFIVYRDGTLATSEEVGEILNRDITVYPGSFRLIHFGHEHAEHAAYEKLGRDVYLEICDTNAHPHKPNVSNEELARRAAQNIGRHPTVITRNCPFIGDKLSIFRGARNFIVGADVAQIMLDPKLAKGGEESILQTLKEIHERHAKIQVLSRDGLTADDLKPPIRYAHIFESLSGTARISSTQLDLMKEGF